KLCALPRDSSSSARRMWSRVIPGGIGNGSSLCRGGHGIPRMAFSPANALGRESRLFVSPCDTTDAEVNVQWRRIAADKWTWIHGTVGGLWYGWHSSQSPLSASP